MVYSVRTDRPIISTKPLKTKRVEGEHSKKVREFMDNHKVSINTNANGDIIVNVKDNWYDQSIWV